jgi:hypothetical protein
MVIINLVGLGFAVGGGDEGLACAWASGACANSRSAAGVGAANIAPVSLSFDPSKFEARE